MTDKLYTLYQYTILCIFAFLAYTLGVDMQMPGLGFAVAMPVALALIASIMIEIQRFYRKNH